MVRIAWWPAVRQFLHPVRRDRRRLRRVQLYRPWLEILERRLPPTVTLSVSDPAPFPKPDSGQVMGIFVVTRSGELAPAVQVDYATQDGSGPHGAHAGIDYVATAGTLKFAAFQTTATITVPVLGNNVFQADKTFTVSLSNPLPSAVFAPQQAFATGTNPYSVAVGDFNGDGKPDLAVTSSSTLSVLLNTTTPGATIPSFAPQQTFAAGGGTFVTVGDFNGDGKPDLAITNNNVMGSVWVLINTTPPAATIPSFAPLKTFTTGSAPAGVAVGDFNGDGKPDLAVANSNSSTVSVLLNTTAPGATIPSFAPQRTFTAGNNPFVVAVGDFNGDGKPDLATTNVSSNTVSVLLNMTLPEATTPTFASLTSFLTGVYPEGMAVGDFNGDGKPDLAVANWGSNTVSVLLNTTPARATAPSFTPRETFATGFEPRAVTVGDFNGDGQPDLALVNFGSGTVSVLLNSTPVGATTSRFTPQQSFATGASPKSVAVGDFNSDNKPDLAIANNGSGTVSVLLNMRMPITVGLGFTPQQTFATATPSVAVAVGDFNGDGKPDLAIASYGFGTVTMLLNTTAAGETTPAFAPPQTFATDNFPDAVGVGDFNGDGKPDLAIAGFTGAGGTVEVLLNTTTPGATTLSFAPQQTFAIGGNFPTSVAVADFNGDGKPDLAIAFLHSSSASVLLNTTPAGATVPSFTPPRILATDGHAFSVAVGDFNGDGKPDLAITNYNADTVSVLLNTTPAGATVASFAPQQTFATGRYPLSVAVGDFNSDGKPDLAVTNEFDNSVSVLLNTTASGATIPSFTVQKTFTTGFRPCAVAIGDFTGDGKPDLAVTAITYRLYGTVSALLNTTPVGATVPSFAPQQNFAVGIQPLAVVIGDFNSDDKPDLAVANYGTNAVSVLLNTALPITLNGSPATGTISSAAEAPVTIAAVEGTTPQAAVVDTAFAVPLAVEVRDAAGHLVQGVRVIFKAPRRGPSGTFDGSTSVTVVTDANGLAAAPSFVANTVAGSYLVRAHAAGGSRPATDFSLTNTPAAAVAFQVLAPESEASGTPFDVTVIAVDSYGNTDMNYTGTVHFSTSDGDPGVILPDDYTFQPGDAGQVTFTGGVTLITPGDQVLTVTDVESGISGCATVTVTDDTGSGRPSDQTVPHQRLGGRTWDALVEAADLAHRRRVIESIDAAWVDASIWFPFE